MIIEEDDAMHKITTWLWFNAQAEEAVHFYVSIFRNARISEITPRRAEANRK